MDEWTNSLKTQANIPKGTSRPNDGIQVTDELMGKSFQQS